ncbi:MAG: Txe/YoeB family addiction module toxin [Chloroflexi bacterium]|nr:Txe/YoeB family addiction module toxin [Chloroflexota bacterium]
MSDSRPERELVFNPRLNADLLHWIRTQLRLAARIMELVDAVRRDPFRGIGKPEPLKGLGPDVWSRRIDDEHRLVYVVGRGRIAFVQARYH